MPKIDRPNNLPNRPSEDKEVEKPKKELFSRVASYAF